MSLYENTGSEFDDPNNCTVMQDNPSVDGASSSALPNDESMSRPLRNPSVTESDDKEVEETSFPQPREAVVPDSEVKASVKGKDNEPSSDDPMVELFEVAISPVMSDAEFEEAHKELKRAYYGKKRAAKWLLKQKASFNAQLSKIRAFDEQ
jgi:hypothetical protein